MLVCSFLVKINDLPELVYQDPGRVLFKPALQVFDVSFRKPGLLNASLDDEGFFLSDIKHGLRSVIPESVLLDLSFRLHYGRG